METIYEPKCAEPPVVVATKTANYANGTPISVEGGVTVIAAENGVDAGSYTGRDKPTQIKLDKKHFHGLVKKLFSTEYKNITLYWFHPVKDYVFFNGTYTTAKKHIGKFKCTFDFEIEKLNVRTFLSMLQSTKIKADQNKIIMSASLIRSMVYDRALEGIQSVLDDCPNYTFIATKGCTLPKDLKIVEKYVVSSLEKLGLVMTAKFKAPIC